MNRASKKYSHARKIVAGICLGGLLLACAPARAQEAPDSYLRRLRNLTESIESSEALLAKYPENDFSPKLMFQLSELYIKRATLKFQRKMLLYEEAESAAGALAELPDPPQIDFGDAIRISRRLLDKFPSIYFRDKVLYRVALCFNEEGKPDEAVKYFAQLSEQTEDERLLEESYFRQGEYYFDKKDYTRAIEFYGHLLESWDSSFFDMALYKLGWSYYSVDNYSKAISTFIYMIEDINLLDQVDDAEALGQSKADLRREAIEYSAICFSEFGGPEKARAFLLPKKDTNYAQDILAHLAALYQKRSYFDSAIAALRVLIEFYPNNVDAGFYQKQIVDNYDLAGEKRLADIEREKLIRDYGPGSSWLQLIPEGPRRDEIIAAAETFLYQLGSEAQQRAQSTQDSLDYAIAIDTYNSYMMKFPTAERAANVQFYLGECYYAQRDYRKAAEAYYDLQLNYPDAEFRVTAAYNRILAYNHLLRRNASTDSTDFFLFNFLGEDAKGVEILKAVNGSQAQLMQASNDFYIFYRESDRVNEVLMNFGQMLFDLTQLDLAKRVYEQVLARPEKNPYLTQAHYKMAQCEFRQNHFEVAEEWFRKITRQFPDSTRFVKRANQMIASAQFRRAQAYLAGGDSLKAAEEFERVAGSAPDSAVAERALFEAARQFETLGDKAKSIILYESMIDKFPRSKILAQALFKAGLLSEDLQYWERAAANYLKVFHHDRFSEFAPKSLFSAAKCYENAERFDLASQTYQEYLDAYIQDPDRYLEAAFRKGEIAMNQARHQAALKEFRFVLKAYKKFVDQGISVESYIPANSQFLIAEVAFKTFERIDLSPPLRRKLKRKRALFQKVIRAYTAAAKYRVAEWTTASSFKIGMTFESFADALYRSPRPKKLSTSDLQKYDRKLRERVLPFKQKALETYAASVKSAEKNHIDNDWVSESRKRLEALSGELGLTQLSAQKDKDS